MNDHIKSTLKQLADKDDQKAFRVFFHHYYARLIKFALLFVPLQDQAEEIISEVLIKLLKQRKKLFKLENFEGYLFLAVKNQAISFKRKQKIFCDIKSLEFEKDHLLDNNDPEKSLEYNELSNFIDSVVNSLPPRRQMIFKLVKEEKQKIKEVAALLELAPKTVENHLDMAMKELRSAIVGYLNDRSSKTPVIKIAKIISLLILLVLL